MQVNNISLINLLEHAHIGVVIHRWDTTIVYANPAALTFLDTTLENLQARNGFDERWEFIDRENRRLHIEEFPVNKVINLRTSLHDEIIGIVNNHSGDVTWLKVNAYPEGSPDENASASFVVVYFTEVTDQIINFSFQDIVQNAQDMIIVTEAADISGPLSPRIIYVNDAICKISGYSAEELIGETPRILQGTLTDKTATTRIRQALQEKLPVNETLLNYTKSGTPYWVEMNIFPLKNSLGEVTHFAAVERDVSTSKFHSEQLNNRNIELKSIRENLENLVRERTRELRTANASLEKLAYFDTLTDIPNRRAFNDAISKALASSRRHNYSILVGIADVDNFKQLNDTYGHAFGDDVLIAIADVLKHFFRQEDCIGRIGGEEFAFCMVIPPHLDPSPLLERLRKKVEDIPSVQEALSTVTITVSLGAYCVREVEDRDARKLLTIADGALYKAKENGKNQAHIVYQNVTASLNTA